MIPEPFETFVDRLEHASRQGDPGVDRMGTEAEDVRPLRETYAAIARGDFASPIDGLHE
jgi:hypothetical protein